MNRKLLAAISMCIIAVFLAESAPVSAGGNPFNVSIAKSKKGTYRSGAIDTDQPDANPQKYTRKIEPGKTARFFVKVKNSNPNAEFNAALGGDPDSSDFDVSFFINGVDVSTDYNDDCTSTPIPAGGKVLIEMRVTATGATAGDQDNFGFVEGGSSCGGFSPHDTVWGIVKVI